MVKEPSVTRSFTVQSIDPILSICVCDAYPDNTYEHTYAAKRLMVRYGAEIFYRV